MEFGPKLDGKSVCLKVESFIDDSKSRMRSVGSGIWYGWCRR